MISEKNMKRNLVYTILNNFQKQCNMIVYYIFNKIILMVKIE